MCKSWAELVAFLVSEEANGRWSVSLTSLNEEDYFVALAAVQHLRHVTLFVDEALWFTSSRDLCERLVKVARANAHFGHGIGVPLWMTCQRPLDLPPDVRSQLEQVISFAQREPRDIQFLSERFNPTFADGVRRLSGHDWLSCPELKTEKRHASSGGRHSGSGDPDDGLPAVPANKRDRQTSSDHLKPWSPDNRPGRDSQDGKQGNPVASTKRHT